MRLQVKAGKRGTKLYSLKLKGHPDGVDTTDVSSVIESDFADG